MLKEQAGSVFTCSTELPNMVSPSGTSGSYKRIGKQIWLKVGVNGNNIMCQWGTGSTVSMVGRDGYKQLGCSRLTPINKAVLAYGKDG